MHVLCGPLDVVRQLMDGLLQINRGGGLLGGRDSGVSTEGVQAHLFVPRDAGCRTLASFRGAVESHTGRSGAGRESGYPSKSMAVGEGRTCAACSHGSVNSPFIPLPLEKFLACGSVEPSPGNAGVLEPLPQWLGQLFGSVGT